MGSLPILKTSDDVVRAIETGNSREYLHLNLELKERWAQAYGDKISALANKLDQTTTFLAVGVSDDGTVMQHDEKWAKNTEAVISQHVNQSLDPLQVCKAISCKNTKNGWVVILTIQNAGEVTYWGEYAYCASGTTIKRMGPADVLTLRIQLPGLIDYSKQYHKSTYNERLVRRFVEQIVDKRDAIGSELNTAAPEELLQRLGLFERQAARLLFGRASYRLVRYDDEQQPISNNRLDGLISLLLPEFIKGLCHEGDGHFSERALKEALANAVAHAAYFENDGEIMVEVYPDCITVSNLCIKESTYFANRWFSRSHKTINGLLMETLRMAGYVDELGRGKNLIFSDSIKSGKRPPEVHIETAGKYQRWKLMIYGGKEDQKLVRLLERCREIYNDERKALIALALVLWRHRSVTEIRGYVDGDFARQFAEVLTGVEGPIFYYPEKETIYLTRWAAVLLGEGKDSKALSRGEEQHLQNFAFDICSKYHGGIITPQLLREFAHMSETKSEQVLSSNILSKWTREGIVKKAGKGKYEFVRKPGVKDAFEEVLNTFQIPLIPDS
jgi:predicted HTH transcriptional regulator